MGNGGLMGDEFEVHSLNVSRGVEIGARTGDGRQIQANPGKSTRIQEQGIWRRRSIAMRDDV